MVEQIIVDFRDIPDPPEEKRDVRFAAELLSASMPEVDPTDYDDRPVANDEIESIKATFVKTSGNIAETARQHKTSPARVKSLSLRNGWTLYGTAKDSHEKASTTKLRALAESLEHKMYELLGSLEVETKELADPTKDGLNTHYIASLSARNTAFKDVFDRYMRVQALLEPETFGEDKGGSNSVARFARMDGHPDALGGVEGINRQITALIAGIVVTEDHVRTPPEYEATDVIEVEDVSAERDQ